jgi:hypothetical protein
MSHTKKHIIHRMDQLALEEEPQNHQQDYDNHHVGINLA